MEFRFSPEYHALAPESDVAYSSDGQTIGVRPGVDADLDRAVDEDETARYMLDQVLYEELDF